jgi:hypothetical protein
VAEVMSDGDTGVPGDPGSNLDLAPGWPARAGLARVACGVDETILLWLPPTETTAALTPGLLIGAAATLLYLWWRWR